MQKNNAFTIVAATLGLILALVIPTIFLSAILIGGQWFNQPLGLLWLAMILEVILVAISLTQARYNQLRYTGQIMVLITLGISITGLGMTLFFVTMPVQIAGSIIMLRPRPSISTSYPVNQKTDGGTEHMHHERNGFTREKPWLQQLNQGLIDEPHPPYFFYQNTDRILALIPIEMVALIFVVITVGVSTQGHRQPHAMRDMSISLAIVFVIACVIILLVWAIVRATGKPRVSLTASGITYQHFGNVTTASWSDITHFELRTVPDYNYGSRSLYIVCVRNPAQYGLRATTRSARSQKRARFWVGQLPQYYQAELPGAILVIPLRSLGVEPQRFNQLVTQCWQKFVTTAGVLEHDRNSVGTPTQADDDHQ